MAQTDLLQTSIKYRSLKSDGEAGVALMADGVAQTQ